MIMLRVRTQLEALNVLVQQDSVEMEKAVQVCIADFQH